MPADAMRGVLSPVVTPFDAELRPDRAAWLAHCRWLLSQECGLAIFGTNSEANSLAVAERRSLLEAAFEAGLDPARMMPGTASPAFPETVELTRAAVDGGAAGLGNEDQRGRRRPGVAEAAEQMSLQPHVQHAHKPHCLPWRRRAEG